MREIIKLTVVFLLLSLGSGIPVFAQENTLLALKIVPLPDSRVRLDFHFSNPIKKIPSTFITPKPARLVVDFLNTRNSIDPTLMEQKIQLGNLEAYKILNVAGRVRAVLDLSRVVSYTGRVRKKTYCLTLSGKSHQIFHERKEVFVTNHPVNARYEITGIDFRGIEKQGGRLILDVNDDSIPIDVTQTGREVVANFNNTRLPRALIKRYDVQDFHSPTQFISAQQVGNTAKLILVNKGDYAHFAYQVNKQFFIDIVPLTAEEIKEAKLKKKVFTGKRISLNFQNIEIRAVLQLLAEFTGINIVATPDVKGTITLRLSDVPWDQALDIILSSQGLDKRQVGNVILVDLAANFAKREAQELKAIQDAQVLQPLRAELIQINYAKAADIALMLKDKENSLLSKRGNLSVDTRTNTIWIQDTGTQIDVIRDLVKHLDIPVRQVVIETRIVNVTKECIADLGIRWGISKPPHLSGTLEGANQLAQGIPPADVPIPDRLNVDLGAPVANPASIGLALAKLGDGVLLDLELSALESIDKAEIIASPRLMTTDQQPALIESGEEIPYQEATSSGATAVAFKKAVLSLKVTPQITPDNRVLLNLQINQDAPSAREVQGVPAINTKEIQTTVLVNNGQTVVLGGIYKRDKNNTVTMVPWLGELPLLGVLFRNQHTRIRNEELLIFITPRIITNALTIETVEGYPRVFAKGVKIKKVGRRIRPWK